MIFRFACAAILLTFVMGTPAAVGAAPLRLVASIKPVQALVEAIAGEESDVHLIVGTNASPHTYALKPSDARALADADTIFWIGPALETFLSKPLLAVAGNNRTVMLGAETTHAHTHESEAGHDHAEAADPHFWLSPTRAREMVRTIADTLIRLRPAQAAIFESNLVQTLATIEAVESEVQVLVAPFRDAHTIVLHAAYGHFTDHFGLRPMTALSLSPEQRPGPKRIAEIRDMIAEKDIRCVFAEPQFPSRSVELIARDTDARTARLDPLGTGEKQGVQFYVGLLRKLALSFKACLSR